MKFRPLVTDLVLSVAAGYLGTKAMEPLSMKLYELEPAGARAREDAARPGPPFRIAADKLSKLAGWQLDEAALDKLSLAFHYGLAISWAPMYPLLRRHTTWSPPIVGLVTGAAMSVLADELMTPAFGFSAPNLDYPLVTHLRGLAAHLAFGLTVAAATETGRALLRRLPLTRRSSTP